MSFKSPPPPSFLLVAIVCTTSLLLVDACPFSTVSLRSVASRPSGEPPISVARLLPNCRKTQPGRRCAGAPGQPSIRYKGCCVGECRADASKGWGKWCPDAAGRPEGGRDAARKCLTTFKGRRVGFDSCQLTGLRGGVAVFWSVDAKANTVTTLFRARPPAGGWVAFGWFANSMVPANAAVAFVDKASNTPLLQDYKLSSRFPAGVRPASGQNISQQEADISSIDGTISGLFTRPMRPLRSGNVSAIYAVGPQVSDAALGYHSVSGVASLAFSAAPGAREAKPEAQIVVPKNTASAGGGPTNTSATRGPCQTPFKGEMLLFENCRSDLKGGLKLYWTIKGGSIRTLFEQTTPGWSAFSWGYKKMVPGAAAVAYIDPLSRKAVLKDYSLGAKVSAGVRPGKSLKIFDQGADVSGSMIKGLFSMPYATNWSRAGYVSAIWAQGPSVKGKGKLSYHSSRFSESINLASVQHVDEIVTPSPEARDENEEEAGAGPNGAGPNSCSVNFKGNRRKFQACRVGLEGGVNVYWDIDVPAGTIQTLISRNAKTGYVGWGWGSQTMVPANATVLYVNSRGRAVLRDYGLRGKSGASVRPLTPSSTFQAETDLSEGFMKGIFTQKLGDKVISGPTDAIWAVGEMSSGTSLAYHSSSNSGRFDLSKAASNGDSVGLRLSRAFVIHGVLMAIAWLVLCPAGVFTMRFGAKRGSLHFKIHRAVMVIMYLTTVAALALALAKGSRAEKLHFGLGIAVAMAATLQVGAGFCRPAKGTTFWPLFQIVHSIAGRVIFCAAVANIFIGLRIAQAPKAYFIAPIGVCVIAVVLGVIFAIPRKQDEENPVCDSTSSTWSGD